MAEIPKKLMRELRTLAEQAYAEELHRALEPLAVAFDKWKIGEIDSYELCDMIHQFHNGPARDLFKTYRMLPPKTAVAHAIAAGILDRSELSDEILQLLENLVEITERYDLR